MKQFWRTVALAVILVWVGALVVLAMYGDAPGAPCTIALPRQKLSIAYTNTRVAHDCIHLESVSEPAARERGLSGRDHLAPTDGMLFRFDVNQPVCVWMKDMKFPLDILWLDADRRITYSKQNVQPDTYPQAFCHDAQYVVEVNAGTIKAANLRLGQQLTF